MSGLQPQHWEHPAMRILKHGIRRERTLQTSFAGALLLLGLWAGSRAFPGFWGWLGVVAATVAILWLLRLKPWQSEREHRLAQLLRDQPERIVWVYGLVTQMSPYGFRFNKQGIMYFKLDNGDEVSLLLPSAKLKLISRFLNRVLPHATFGYDAEKASMYADDPIRLRRPGDTA